MRFKEFRYNDEIIYQDTRIDNILEQEKLYWLIDSEIENAVIDIKNKTVIWHSGNYYAGNWHYGIWKSGSFYGIWENGIFEEGEFKGEFISGIMNSKNTK